MTAAQPTKGRRRLREARTPEGAMKLHSCVGEDGRLQVFDVWESQEAFDEFLTFLGPVMEELGIELAQPPVKSVKRTVMFSATGIGIQPTLPGASW
jgi:hypothetical protein